MSGTNANIATIESRIVLAPSIAAQVLAGKIHVLIPIVIGYIMTALTNMKS